MGVKAVVVALVGALLLIGVPAGADEASAPDTSQLEQQLKREQNRRKQTEQQIEQLSARALPYTFALSELRQGARHLPEDFTSALALLSSAHSSISSTFSSAKLKTSSAASRTARAVGLEHTFTTESFENLATFLIFLATSACLGTLSFPLSKNPPFPSCSSLARATPPYAAQPSSSPPLCCCLTLGSRDFTCLTLQHEHRCLAASITIEHYRNNGRITWAGVQ